MDECLTMFASCGNGLCVNTVGSFRCECNEGYTPSQAGTVCVGEYRMCWGGCVGGVDMGVCRIIQM